MRNLTTDFADSHGSNSFFLLPDPRESVARSLHRYCRFHQFGKFLSSF
jgi:hypothetical protein